MWICPKCERHFKSTNQSHMCAPQDLGALFQDKPDDLVLAFDAILTRISGWEPNYVGASTKSIVCTNSKAWLIIKPMKEVLDVKFYCDEHLDHEILHAVKSWGKKYAHHIRIAVPEQVTDEFIRLLRIGYDFALE